MASPLPMFSVVMPLHDHRGSALASLSAWCKQRSPASPFQLIIVDSGLPQLARECGSLLADGDQIVEAKTTNEARLYNAGGRVARANWILFTESHVLPTASTSNELCAQLPSLACEAAILGCSHITRSRFAAVDARLTEAERDSMHALGLWRLVGLRGFLIRRHIFDQLDGFTERYRRFAEIVLAIRLVTEGHRLIECPDIVVQHIDTCSWGELCGAMASGQVGVCRFWEAEPDLAQRFFGGLPPWHQTSLVNPRLARRLWADLAHSFARCEVPGANLRLALTSLWIALLGWRVQTLAVWLRAFVATLRFRFSLHVRHRPEWRRTWEPVIAEYRQLREKCAELGTARFLVSRAGRVARRTLTWDQLGTDSIAFYPAELWQGKPYRWSAPAAAILLHLAPANYRIRLDARPTGGWTVRCPKVSLNGRMLGQGEWHECDGIIDIEIGAEDCRADSVQVLSWECVAFEPARRGLPDRRKLGLALIDVQVESVSDKQREMVA